VVLNDFEAHSHVMSISTQNVVQELVDLLGLTLVAAIGGVGETRAVSQWMTSREPQRPHVLRFALQLARMIDDIKGNQAVRAWFMGSNPHLEDRSPVMVLRVLPLEQAQTQLMAASRAFIHWDEPHSS
jgi:hypothetical protein